MISSRKELLFYIAADRIMANRPVKISWKDRVKNIISPDYILMYLCSMRYIAYYKNVIRKNKSLHIKCHYHRWRFTRLGIKLGFSIGYNSFGYGLLIPHHGTIVVHRSVKAGNYCVLHTSTCIGGKGKVIGDGLYLSTGSIIMGAEVLLGNNISIASNSLINKSVPVSNVLLAGTPGVIKSPSLPWYERDGDDFRRRVKAVEKLRQEMNF